MIRRRFLQLLTVAGAGGLRGFAGERAKRAAYQVKGFSCATCATGLDAMLGKESGIVSSKSTYPEGVVTVNYLPEKTSEEWIAAFITDLGFTVEGRSKG
jgi:Cu+-exporting ATPase